MAELARPYPPAELLEPTALGPKFLAAPEIERWLRQMFLSESSPFFNPDHEHLTGAAIGCLWTNVEHVRGMRQIAATAEMPRFQGNIWQKARQAQQMSDWFGGNVPDFVLTFDALFAAAAETDHATWCAVVEHELYHCAQVMVFGCPKYRKDGTPVFALRGHDVEEFVGVVRRYGVTGSGGAVRELVTAAQEKPLLAAGEIAQVCGTCLKGRR